MGWIEIVHLEDLVLHDAGHDIRTPTHELTIARDVLRTRRRIAAQPFGLALSPEGLRSLRGQAAAEDFAAAEGFSNPAPCVEVVEPARGGEGSDPAMYLADPLTEELAAIDAVLARSEAALTKVRAPSGRGAGGKDSLVYDLDWDEDARLEEWHVVLTETEGLPPVCAPCCCSTPGMCCRCFSTRPGSAGIGCE
ncbi:hypothetical protein ACVMB2_003569 [Sinorhizobium meliloti]